MVLFQNFYYVIALFGYEFGTSTGRDSTCNVQTINHRLTADCSKQNFTQVPQNLSHDIEVLDLSNNFQMDLREYSFKNYTNLIVLKIEQLKLRDSVSKAFIHPETFLPLIKLEILLLNGAKIFQITMKWPSNVRILNVDGNRLQNIHLTNLNKLENLSIEFNDLIDLPETNELATIKILHAGGNPMEKLTAESLSRYCLLESVQMDLQKKGITKLNTAYKYCQCIRVKKFFTKIQLKGDIRLGCVKQNGSLNCNLDFNEAAKSRYKCLKRHGRIHHKKESYYVNEFNDIGTGGSIANLKDDDDNDDGDENADGTPSPEQYRGVLYYIWRVLLGGFIITVIIGLIIRIYKHFIKARKAKSSMETSHFEEAEEEELEE